MFAFALESIPMKGTNAPKNLVCYSSILFSSVAPIFQGSTTPELRIVNAPSTRQPYALARRNGLVIYIGLGLGTEAHPYPFRAN